MTALARITLLSLVLGLSACAVHRASCAHRPDHSTVGPVDPAEHQAVRPGDPSAEASAD
jgi:hypothetical protein